MPRRLIVGLLLCMLVMQSLGQWHRVVHAQGPGHGAAFGTGSAQAHAVAKLFGSHHGNEDCLAFDQATPADVAFGALSAAIHEVPEAAAVARVQWQAPTPQLTAYLARAPPQVA